MSWTRSTPALLVVAALAIVIALSPVGAGTVKVVRLLVACDVAALRDHVRAAGAWVPAVSIALMVLQAVIAPSPHRP